MQGRTLLQDDLHLNKVKPVNDAMSLLYRVDPRLLLILGVLVR